MNTAFFRAQPEREQVILAFPLAQQCGPEVPPTNGAVAKAPVLNSTQQR